MRSHRCHPWPPLLLTVALFAPAALGAQPPDRELVEEDLDERQAQSPPAAVGALEAEAQQAYADGDLARAIGLYRALAEGAEGPSERARHHLTTAWLLFQLGDAAGATSELVQALFEDPATPFRADLYNAEFTALHQDALRDALLRRRSEAVDRLNRAVAEISAGRYEAARRLLEEGLRLGPDDPDGLYNLAVVDQRTGRQEAALAGFERVLALERGRPESVSRELKAQALNNAAVIYFARGQFDDAETALGEAVKLDRADAKAWYNLGLTRARLGRKPEALAAYRRARELDPRDVDVARQIGLAHIERQEWVEAVAVLLEATREQPETPDLWIHLGRAQRGLGNLQGALESLARALELDPGNRAGDAETAALLLAEVRLAGGDILGAAAAASLATQFSPERPDGWVLLGLARLRADDPGGAAEALSQAAALAPDRADILHNLGSALLAKRDLVGAEAAFRRVLEIEPASAEAAAIVARLEAQKSPPATERRGAQPPALGAQLKEVDYPALGLRGLLVEQVAAGSPAARGGLQVGDLVLRADGAAVTTPAALASAFAAARRELRLEILRQGRQLELRLNAG